MIRKRLRAIWVAGTMGAVVAGTLTLGAGTASAAGSCPASTRNATIVQANFQAFDTGAYTRPEADGLVDMEDMRRVADGAGPYSIPPDVREAARYFVDNPAEFAHMDGIRVRWTRFDGLVNRDDVADALRYWRNECG
ncbi:hypothetical protein [Microbispora sp. NBRC 16548]|uniref:hypothetical protein n=1 Tax=Microbispora sp. NBRC 16548 TaxID=3030994 RepID=UPI0024A55B97|nr:hypothetical protein [Microbispora sp. NBRC 16548]GLX08987.1 hypothetical protein Misp03_59130 [Microbispora sp. NBRC 16548]